jgi:hypothetical protein
MKNGSVKKTTQDMMIDMQNIVEIPCSRRVIYRTNVNSPVVIYCKPPLDKLKDLPASEAIKNADLFVTKIVSIETCKKCSERDTDFQLKLKKPELLQDGTIIYKKDETDWEPPPSPPGYKRKSNDPKSPDAWVLIPEQPFCIYVEFEKKKSNACGCEKYSLFCTREGQRILLRHKETCQECPHRIERKCNV